MKLSDKDHAQSLTITTKLTVLKSVCLLIYSALVIFINSPINIGRTVIDKIVTIHVVAFTEILHIMAHTG